jgi:predicted RNase H-like nuclease (RuvC/YqgF family)
MTAIPELLTKQAERLEKLSETVQELADIKQSAISTLVEKGIDKEAAEKAVETSEVISNSENSSIGDMTRVVDDTSKTLRKAAEYIGELESKLEQLSDKNSTLDKQASEFQAKIKVVERRSDPENPLNKLAGIGFSDEEIDALKNLPDEVLHKVAEASTNDREDGWSLGKAAGAKNQGNDPLLDFLLS